MIYEMHFSTTRTRDGLYHVQNVVGGMLGQHHCHTAEGYRYWKSKTRVLKQFIHTSKGECDCGLKAGQVRSHDGAVRFNPLFV